MTAIEFYKTELSEREDIPMVRIGDWFETYGEHAKRFAALHGATLSRRRGFLMAGIPYHLCFGYKARDGDRLSFWQKRKHSEEWAELQINP